MIQGRERSALVVDDEPTFTAHVTEMFEALGFAVDSAKDGRAALSRLTERRADVVCVSLLLPRESGYDLCESIRKDPELAQTRIILVSDRCTPEVLAYAEEAGANAFLRRPFRIDLLSDCVTSLLDVRAPAPAGLRVTPLPGYLAAE